MRILHLNNLFFLVLFFSLIFQITGDLYVEFTVEVIHMQKGGFMDKKLVGGERILSPSLF